MEKIFCRVDETGQDTKGQLFIVGVANVSNLEQARNLAEQLEQEPLKQQRNGRSKGLRKWVKLKDEEQIAYVRLLLATNAFKGGLFYKVYSDTTRFQECTVDATIQSIKIYLSGRIAKVDVRIDGLTESERQLYAKNLRKAGLRTDKVRGGKDETDALIRLVDALCGFVRAAQTKQGRFAELLERAEREGFIIHIGK